MAINCNEMLVKHMPNIKGRNQGTDTTYHDDVLFRNSLSQDSFNKKI